MNLLLILIAIGLVALLCKVSADALNLRAEANYGYRPINLSTSLFATSACLVGVIGGLVIGAAGLVAGLLLFLFLLFRVATKTSLLVALLSLPLFAIIGMGPVIVIGLLYLMAGQKDQENK